MEFSSDMVASIAAYIASPLFLLALVNYLKKWGLAGQALYLVSMLAGALLFVFGYYLPSLPTVVAVAAGGVLAGGAASGAWVLRQGAPNFVLIDGDENTTA